MRRTTLLHERLVQLLALEVQVPGRSYHAQDHEGVPHESIRRASIEEVRELDEAQEVEGLGVGLEIKEGVGSPTWAMCS